MFSFLHKKYKLEDLDEIQKMIVPDRDNFRIAIIDDQKISIVGIMQRHGFRIDYFKDIYKIDELQKYNIIVCDIEGVGKKFGSFFEGGHLIKEIRTHYPLKYLIAYSGKSFDVRYNDFFKLCDNVMHKQSDITECISCLDNSIKLITNPIYQWQRAREQLLNNKVSIDIVSKLEQSYIKSILKRDKTLFDKVNVKNNFDYANTIATVDAIGTYIQVILGFLQTLDLY